MWAGNFAVMRLRTVVVYLYFIVCCNNEIHDLCIIIYIWCSCTAVLYWVLAIVIWYCVYAGSMTNVPGIDGGTKGAPGATMLYCAELTRIPKYQFAPPPRVHGTAAVFAFSFRNISCNLSKVGSPMIFVSTLYSKYKLLRLIFAVVLMLENSLGDTPLLIVGMLWFVALCFALQYVL